MKFPCVLFCVIAFVSCKFISSLLFQKKLHLDLSVSSLCLCSAFSAFNSLQILQVIHCKPLWDPTCLVSWGDKCFSLCKLGFTDLLFSVQPNPFGTTETFHSVPPTSQQEKQFATCSIFLLIQLHSMNLVLYKHHIFISALFCDSRTKPIHDKFQKALLGNWCQRGRERSHQSLSSEREITSKSYHLQRRNLQGGENTQGPQMLDVQE